MEKWWQVWTFEMCYAWKTKNLQTSKKKACTSQQFFDYLETSYSLNTKRIFYELCGDHKVTKELILTHYDQKKIQIIFHYTQKLNVITVVYMYE